MPYIPHSPQDLSAMLKTVGVSSIEDLFADIPQNMRPKSFALPDGKDEMTVCAHLEELAAKNKTGIPAFLGAGFYNHYIPKTVNAITGRGEFFTAYTPYQAEASQGTLQAIFEYQTAICRLLQMDCANASVYDGGSALFEALMMAARVTGRRHFILDQSVNPLWREMVLTSTKNLDVEFTVIPHVQGMPDIKALDAALDDTVAAVVVQNPNFFGVIADYSELFASAKEKGALGVISVNPVMQSLLKTPGEMGADIAVAEGQALGQPLSFGGPYLGIMACKKSLVRQLPGRIAGRTIDKEGREGYVLTLQAREQHIRRSKATSNICSNQALCALRSLVHMCLLGPEGLIRTAEISMINAREAAAAFLAIPGVSMLNDAPYGYEFAVTLPVPAEEAVKEGLKRDCVIGCPVGENYPGMEKTLLVACTEKNTPEQIKTLSGVLADIFGGQQ